jgi:putative phosphoesterase
LHDAWRRVENAAARPGFKYEGGLVKLGIISDIHCNLYGFNQALAAMESVDEIICLGDIINEYQFSNEAIAALKARGAHVILGNHEEVFLSSAGARAREDKKTDRELVKWLAEQPLQREFLVGGKKVLMIHSTPWEPRGSYIFPHSEQLERFAEVEADFVLYGHTHAHLARRVGGVLVVNPGAAGEPFYDGDSWRLGCAILDTTTEEVERIDFPDPRYPESA